MIPPKQFLDHVITPVLSVMASVNPALGHPTAPRLLLGTAVRESGIEALEQSGSGPALSMFQIEPTTFDWLWRDHVLVHSRLGAAVGRFLFQGIAPIDQLPGNQHLACAIARLRYWVVPELLPAPDDVDGMASYWGRHYQTKNIQEQVARWASGYNKHCYKIFS